MIYQRSWIKSQFINLIKALQYHQEKNLAVSRFKGICWCLINEHQTLRQENQWVWNIQLKELHSLQAHLEEFINRGRLQLSHKTMKNLQRRLKEKGYSSCMIRLWSLVSSLNKREDVVYALCCHLASIASY